MITNGRLIMCIIVIVRGAHHKNIRLQFKSGTADRRGWTQIEKNKNQSAFICIHLRLKNSVMKSRCAAGRVKIFPRARREKSLTQIFCRHTLRN
jgi:hypothetical protein